MGILKALFQKITSWFGSEAGAIEARIVVDAKQAEQFIASELERIATLREESMSTPAAAPAAPATTSPTIDSAIKIALSLKAIDPNLTDAAVQAATNAALTAAYPAA
jgi:hypothetical protein